MATQVLSAEVNINVNKATDGLNKLSNSVKNTTNGIQAGTAKIQKGTQALTDFSRVVQDAPFGLIGIGNNITQLADSFGRLKSETGSGKAAFSALVGSLTGPAGLSLAISAVITGLTLAQTGFAAWTQKTKEAKEKLDEFTKATIASREHVEEQKVSLESLVSIAKGDVGTKEQQKLALQELNKLIPDNVGHLTQQNIKTAEGTAILNTYTNALVAQAEAELLAGRAAKLRVEQFDRGKTLFADIRKEQNEFAKAQQQIAAGGGVAGALSGVSVAAKAVEGLGARSSEAFKNFQKAGKEIAELEARIAGLTATGLESKNIVDGKKTAKVIEDTLQHSDINLPIRTVTLESGLEIRAVGQPFKGLNEQLRNAGFLKEINTTLATAGRGLDPTLLLPVEPFATQAALVGRTISVTISEEAKRAALAMQEHMTRIAEAAKRTSEIVQNTLGGAFQSFFETLITTGDLAINQLVDDIKKLVIRLLAAAAAAAAVAAIITAITGGAGGAGFLSSFKGAFASFTGLPKFANGGVVNGPTMGLLGEANKSEAIIPLDRLEQMMSSGGGGDTITTRVSGDDLILVLDRAGRRQRRNF